MRVPISWLAEYVDLPEGTTVADLHAALVRVGFEEEAEHGFGVSGPVVVGEVLELTPEPQSNGKTIRWCQVRVAPQGRSAADGGADVRGVVCGAANFEVGDKVVVTLPGAVLPGPFPIAARKTYGHVSDGMIASARELGLGDEHDGILRLVTLGLDPEVGTDALRLLGLDDRAVEVNVTPDRGYAFSVRGIAREYSHSTGAVFRDPAALARPLPPGDGFPVAIQDDAPLRGRVGASVFLTRAVRGIDPTRPTPPWLASRLRLAGIRSISLPVDITNYVMLELGEPVHAYDLDRLTGGIVVRRATPGERLTTLDGQTRTLSPEDLLITDGSGPIGLAGVMGGAHTEISEGTRNVLIETAIFDPVSIARTARRHKLPSEASKRYERGVDPAVADAASARVVQLLVDLAGGTPDPLGSAHAAAEPPAPIDLPDGYIARLVGVDYADEEIRRTLVEIGADIADQDGGLRVTPPTWRPDLVDSASLAEEVARLAGYDRIPSVLPVAPPGRGLTRAQKLRRSVAQLLAANGGVEVLAFPFVRRQQNDRFGSADGSAVPAVKLANPIDAEAPYLRTSLLPGLIEIASRNRSRGFVDLDLFEVGSVFRPEPGVQYGTDSIAPLAVLPTEETFAAMAAGIPPQPRHVATLRLGSAIPKQPGQEAVAADWRDALTSVQRVAAALRVTVRPVQGTHQALHPGRTARIVADTPSGEETVGWAGELLPSLAEEADLPHVVAVAELDLTRLLALADPDAHAVAIRTLPAATQDLSLVVGSEVPAGDVQRAVAEGAGGLLEDIRLLDDYRGAGVPDGSKSLTFALRFRAEDRTLTAAEASEAKLAGVAVAGERYGASLRE
ncbi:MAG: phenylalanine--tRNA ligase subunit beta [Naasia sp.]|jgi:phenylalanyl-tRNA synthetase beta chain|uniref:phenylalanine--tRNA ligase subunit beta n=1 Tax=Naasia sp. TaxID=2546198 RepID=UPI00262A8826|nr:phenylalanine--tRNA ligase subunit beta [Naasia sp.]MCU1571259.1 phenylalanine--tRNA ligase subunit beta [Naasia sp.]